MSRQTDEQMEKEIMVLGLTAPRVTLDAIKASGGTDYAKLSDALKKNFVETTVGKIKFDGKGDAEGVGFSVYQVQGGKFVEQ